MLAPAIQQDPALAKQCFELASMCHRYGPFYNSGGVSVAPKRGYANIDDPVSGLVHLGT